MKEYYVFRNFTLEYYFNYLDADFSPYGDISVPDVEYDNFIWFFQPSYKASVEEVVIEINDYIDIILLLVSKIPKNSCFFIFELDVSFFLCLATNNDYRLEKSIMKFNEKVRELSRASNVKFIPFSDFSRQYRISELIDWKYYYISQANFNPKLAVDFKKWFQHQLSIIRGVRKKCIILDLDNTLWGGVLGEDGLYGIEIGNTYPGSAFRDFQLALLEMSTQGIILAACSKNNEADVLEAWDKNPNMVLRKEHFSAWRINWKNKSENIMDIASELNIGVDTCLFIDDSPIERDFVKYYVPDITVPDFPKQPYELYYFFKKNYKKYFQSYKLTTEDKNKNIQYFGNVKRKKFRKKFESIEDYWKSLEMILEIDYANESNITRISQMTQKTNQFNLCTQRYSEVDIVKFVNNNDLVFCLTVKDKFGDNGIAALCIVEISDESATIDSYLLSCRVLGRGIEDLFLHSVINILYKKGISILNSKYIPTGKNILVEMFYEKNNFELLPYRDNDIKTYVYKIEHSIRVNDYCKIIINE